MQSAGIGTDESRQGAFDKTATDMGALRYVLASASFIHKAPCAFFASQQSSARRRQPASNPSQCGGHLTLHNLLECVCTCLPRSPQPELVASNGPPDGDRWRPRSARAYLRLIGQSNTEKVNLYQHHSACFRDRPCCKTPIEP